jgi:hypothetical protein
MILQSKGLIGISLDQRILGFPADNVAFQWDVFPYDYEFIADGEAEVFFRGAGDPEDIVPYEIQDDEVMTGDDAMNQSELTMEFHLGYFLNQVFHILQVAKKNNIDVKEAAGRICIGSDFDGLINAIDCCENAEQYESFKKNLKRVLTRRKNFWQDLSIDRDEIDADTLLEGIFFRNAHEFLKVNFQ